MSSNITLKTQEGQTAEVSPYAGHILSWKQKDGQDLLFMSSKAVFQPPKAIRGGVPICFPQFGAFGPLGQHGFARNCQWTVEEQTDYSVTLALTYDGKQHEKYPYPFVARTRIAICDDNLQQELEVTNTGSETMPFTCALHTYFKVADIAQVQVHGLSGLTYLDSVENKVPKKETAPHVELRGEVDRIYLQAPDSVRILDVAGGRSFTVVKEGFPDAVLWNPHVAKAAAMADFGDDEWTGMVCLEPAVAATGPVQLAPGQKWSGVQKLAAAAL